MVRQPLTRCNTNGAASRLLLTGLIATALTAGCATGYPPQAPTDRTPPGETAPPPASETPPPVAEPAPPARPASNTEAPTLALLRQSQRSADSGDLSGAIAYVERAIRLNPRDATLWLQLARLQLQAGQPARAEQLAQKAIALSSGSDREPDDGRREAWLLVADANEAQGQAEAAERIRERWRTYRG